MKKKSPNLRISPESKQKSIALKKLRTEAGVTLRLLSEVSGYDDGYLCYLENGKRRVTQEVETVYRRSIPIAAARGIAERYRKLIAKMEAA